MSVTIAATNGSFVFLSLEICMPSKISALIEWYTYILASARLLTLQAESPTFGNFVCFGFLCFRAFRR